MQEPADTPGSPATATAPATQTATSNRSALLIVFLVVFIDLLGFGIVLPLLPRFADDYVAAIIPAGKDNPLGGAIVGLLMSSFSLMQFLFAPVWGRVSDRIGRRPILLIGLAGSVVFYALFGYALSLSTATSARWALILLFMARIGAGVAGATIGTAQAVIADCTPPDKRKHGMALIGAAFGIGFTFGPLIGFAALSWFPDNHEAIGYTAAGLSFVALVLGLRLLPETRRLESASSLRRKLLDWSAVKLVLASPALAPVVLTFFLATLGFASFEVTLALVLKDAVGFNEDNTFLVFAFVGMVLMVTQGVIYRRLARRVSETTFMAMGLVLMSLGVAGLGVISLLADGGQSSPPLMTFLFVVLAAAVMGFAFLTPSAQALVSRRSDPGRQGEILGVNQSAAALARIVGPIFGVTLYKTTANHLLPYVLGALLLLLMLPLIPRIRRGDTTGA